MAVYKIFPLKDSYIDEQKPNDNFGRDEILEINDNKNILINFDSIHINNVLSLIEEAEWKCNIRLFLANASSLPLEYSLFFHVLEDSWEMGTGRSSDNPNPQNGVSYSNQPLYLSSTISQSFNYINNKDINQDITTLVSGGFYGYNIGIYSGSNYTSSFYNDGGPIDLQFFSMDTHTIYPPCLEFKWKDVEYSSSISQINGDNFVSVLTNNRGEFNEDSIHSFRISNRDLYPARIFQTSSLYLDNKILPQESYWALKDLKTEEFVIDFDNNSTSIGADDKGNYFNIYFNGLEPERYYQLIWKININNQVIIIDNPENYFKVVR